MALSAGGDAVGGDLLLYYGTVTSSSFGYYYSGGIFCISSGAMQSTEDLAFNTITSYNGTFKSDTGGLHVITPNFITLSEAAWIADKWITTLGSSSDAHREAAQLAIWAVLGMTLANGPAINYLGVIPGAQTLYDDAIAYNTSNGNYTTSNWYAAYNAQDYLTPVPEPGILILLGIAMSAIGMASWKIRKI